MAVQELVGSAAMSSHSITNYFIPIFVYLADMTCIAYYPMTTNEIVNTRFESLVTKFTSKIVVNQFSFTSLQHLDCNI